MPSLPFSRSGAHCRPAAVRLALRCCFASVVLTASATGQETNLAPVEAGRTLDLAPVTVVGTLEDIPRIAGSAAVVDQQQIQRQTYFNPNRVLQQVPGVYVREEDGFGNFPNISLRGADGGRSSKVTIMEDGVMMAPSPYSSPGAYFSPRVGRMSRVEVLKGSSQVRYGPQTTGGVINYISTPFLELPVLMEPGFEPSAGGKNVAPAPIAPGSPAANEFYLKSTYGSFNQWLNHGWWGHTRQTDAGVFGVVVEMFHNQSDGFRHIDKVGGNTGFSTLEPMIRLFWEPDSEKRQRFEFRFGYTYLDANESYLGLTDADLRASPFRRYASTQFDNIRSDQFRYSLTHVIEPRENLRVETTAYHTSFNRNWYKLDEVRDADGGKIGLAQAVGGDQTGYNLLRGRGNGSWIIRANDREHATYGIQSAATWGFDTGEVAHSLSFGARLHYDEASRFQRDDRVFLDGRGGVAGISRGRQGEAGNREENALAWSMWVEDSIRLGRLTIKPGLRWEHVRLEHTDRATSGDLSRVVASGSGSLDALAPGVGLVYELNEVWSAFGGYYRGIATPAPREFLLDGANIEKSDGFEAGFRHYGKSLQAEVVGFFSNFRDLIVRDSLGGAGREEDSNAGSARVYGVEVAARWDALQAAGGDWRLPLRGSATFTRAEITSDSGSADAGSIFSGGAAGSKIPYVPAVAASAGIGVEYRGFGLYLDGTYTGEMYGTARNTSSLRDANGRPDARYGKTDEAFILDLSMGYQVHRNCRLVAGISNLAGEEVIVSRLPFGARANQPRTYFGGLELRF
jgi:Fe(3+) dicitrate transport protein